MTVRACAAILSVIVFATSSHAQDGQTPATDRGIREDFRETGFVVGNDRFEVKCDSAILACRAPELAGMEARKLEAYGRVVADMADRADVWMSGMGFPETDLESLPNPDIRESARPRVIILDDASEMTNSNGFVSYTTDFSSARMVLSVEHAKKVFSGGPSDFSAAQELSPDTLANLSELGDEISEEAYQDHVADLVAHELFHTRMAGRSELHWLDEALATAVGNAWRAKGNYGSANAPNTMRLDHPFNDSATDAAGDTRGYGKAQYFRFVGEEMGATDDVGYIGRFGKLNDIEHGGMNYLYDSIAAGHNFPNSFPRFIAGLNQQQRLTAEAAAKLSTAGFYYTEITRPTIRQWFDEPEDHEIERSVRGLAADPVMLENVTLDFDPADEEHDRLVLVKLEIENAEKLPDLRLVYEHRVLDELNHEYLTVAEGKFDAGYVRVVNVPRRLSNLSDHSYKLKIRFEHVDIPVPDCVQVGDSFELQTDDSKFADIDNLEFEVSENAMIKETGNRIVLTALGVGPLTVTAKITSPITRAHGRTRYVTAPEPQDITSVDLGPSFVAADGGCSCNAGDIDEVANPQMWKMLGVVGDAFGAEGIPETMRMLLPSLMGGEMPLGASTGQLQLFLGDREARGIACVDPLATTAQGDTTIISLYTPSYSVLTGSFDPFSVAHDGWGGWPPNSTAAVHIQMQVAPDEIEEGRTYPARLGALQSAGFAPMFSTYDGEFYDYIPWQEAFTGSSFFVVPQMVGGTVTITEIDNGAISGTAFLGGTASTYDVTHTLRDGTEDTFEKDGDENAAAVGIVAKFSVLRAERGTNIVRAGDYLRTVPAEE